MQLKGKLKDRIYFRIGNETVRPDMRLSLESMLRRVHRDYGSVEVEVYDSNDNYLKTLRT